MWNMFFNSLVEFGFKQIPELVDICNCINNLFFKRFYFVFNAVPIPPFFYTRVLSLAFVLVLETQRQVKNTVSKSDIPGISSMCVI